MNGPPIRKARSDNPNEVLYRGRAITIGLFDCPRAHPMFSDSGPASGDLVVFPRHAVEIAHPGREPVIADTSTITLYNESQCYERRPVSNYGDQSLWLQFQREAVVEALIDAGMTHQGLERAPFRWTHSRCGADTYLAARFLFRALHTSEPGSALQIEERAYGLLRAAIRSVPNAGFDHMAHRASTLRRHRQLTARCRALLASRYQERLTLAKIARDLATTPYHLCRVFAEQSGQTLHAYLMDLRLCAAVDRMIDDPQCRLTDISEDLCFATPSHFARRFRKRFGKPPSAFR